MRIKRVMRYDPTAKLYRVGRVTWERGTVGDGKGYSRKVSLALHRRLFRWEPQHNGGILTVLGVHVHWRKSYGGRFA